MKTVAQRAYGAVLLGMAFPLIAEHAGQQPLPPVETVLKRVVERTSKEAENERAFQQQYRYTRRKVTEYRNGKGDLKKREEKTSVNNPLHRPASAQPLPPVTPTRSPKDPERDEAVSDTHSNVRGKAFEKRDIVLDDELLGRFEFTLARRETVNGRSAFALDFKPANKKLPERNLKDRFINKAAGRVWVDATEYTLTQADLLLTEKVNVVGGLVGAIWQFHYHLVRERTADGFWFTRTVDWHLEGREVFVRRVLDYHEAKTGVQKAQ